MTATAEIEKNKRYDAMKESALVDELIKGKSAAPREMAALAKGNFSFGDNDEILYKNGEDTMVVSDSVKSWLNAINGKSGSTKLTVTSE